MKSISIVMPCYNEENNLKRGVLSDMYQYLKNAPFKWEVIICNDGSTDNSLKLVKDFVSKHQGFRLLDLPHGGKPAAILGGLKEAKHPITLFTDMDQSTPLSELEKLLPFFDQGYDVVIGSRGSSRSNASLVRKIMALGFVTGRRLLLLRNVLDTQCGFKAFTTKKVLSVFPKLSYFSSDRGKKGWSVSAFDVELLFMLQKLGSKIKEVEVKWQDEDTSTTKGDDATRFKKESILMAKEVLRVLYNQFTGKYEKILSSKS